MKACEARHSRGKSLLIAVSTYLFIIIVSGSICPLLAQGSLPGSISPGDSSVEGAVFATSVPLKSASVAIYFMDTLHGTPVLVKQCITRTDSEGHYRCDFLPAGQYLIAVEDKRPSGDKLGAQRSDFFFFPGTRTVDAATLLTVHHHEVQQADISMEADDNKHLLSGSAPTLFSDGALRLSMVSTNGFAYRLSSTPRFDKNGRFTFTDIPDGDYRLEGRILRGNEEYRIDEPVQIAGQDITGLEVLASKSMRLHITEVPPLASGALPIIEDVKTGHRAQIEQNGDDLEATEILKGDYIISLGSTERSCVAKLFLNDRNITMPVHIEGDLEEPSLKMELTSHCGFITGATVGAQRARVVVTTDDLTVLKIVDTSKAGEFVVTGLSAGHYRLFAWSSLDHVPYRMPHYLEGVINSSVNINIEEEGSQSVLNLPVLTPQT